MVSMDIRDTLVGPDLKLFVRDVKDAHGKKRPIPVRSWSTIKDVKDLLQQILHVPPSAIHLYFGPLLTSGRELPNHRTLHDAGIYRSGETLLMDIKNRSNSPLSPCGASFASLRKANDLCISSSMINFTPKFLKSLVAEARRGFSLGLKPDLVLEGSGGTYFLHDSCKNKIAVFKPADEEPYAENNPRGYLPQIGQPSSLREGIAPGEACIREVAAFLLDRDGFAGVPQTTLVEARHPAFHTNGKRLNCSQGGAAIGSHSILPNSPVKPALMKKPGSFQEFIRCECTIDDISPSKVSVEEVHKIAILDIRIMNSDRNAANLLVRRKEDNSLELVPIDHGFCLRSVCDVSWMDWCWLDWPQLKEPLCAKHVQYIQNLDIEADARMLRESLNICEEAVDYFIASNTLLKAGVNAGLTLYDIAVLCCRNDNMAEVPSMMEKLMDMAAELAHVAVESDRWHHSAASRALVEQLRPQHRTSTNSHGANPRLFFKASSSADLSSHSQRLTHFDPEDSPNMAQSSASDSSSNNGDEDEDQEDCDQWAASFIADLTESHHFSASRPARSSSVSSDDDDSAGSPKGFWHVPPGHAKSMDADDGSITSSPRSSSRKVLELDDLDSDSLADGKPSGDLIVDNPTRSDSVDSLPFVPPKVVNFANVVDNIHDVPKPDNGGGMIRSKSYTALSATAGRLRKMSGPSRRSMNKLSDNNEHYKRYFHKFIELVIDRETTAALHNSKHGSSLI